MQLGFVSAILPEQTLTEVVQFAADTGFDCVELMCWPKGKAERRYAGVTHVDVTEFSQAAADEILQCVSDAGVTISGLGYYPNPLTPNAAEAAVYSEHLKKLILAAEMLSVDIVNTFIGRDQTRTIDENWGRFKQVWKPLIQFAADHGIRIGIENCPMFFTEGRMAGLGKTLLTVRRYLGTDVCGDSVSEFRAQLRPVPFYLAADGLPETARYFCRSHLSRACEGCAVRQRKT